MAEFGAPIYIGTKRKVGRFGCAHVIERDRMKAKLDLQKLDDWYTHHFAELVEKYPRQAIAVVKGQVVAVGDSGQEVDQQARRQHPSEIPFVVTVPSEEELICLLSG